MREPGTRNREPVAAREAGRAAEVQPVRGSDVKQRKGNTYGSSTFGFEDLQVYQEARAFRREIYGLIQALPQEEKYALGQQMRRAAISLTANIAEGYGRYHYQETIQFLRQSRGSLMELIDDLNICADEQYATADELAKLRPLAEAVLRLINGYVSYLQRKKAEPKDA